VRAIEEAIVHDATVQMRDSASGLSSPTREADAAVLLVLTDRCVVDGVDVLRINGNGLVGFDGRVAATDLRAPSGFCRAQLAAIAIGTRTNAMGKRRINLLPCPTRVPVVIVVTSSSRHTDRDFVPSQRSSAMTRTAGRSGRLDRREAGGRARRERPDNSPSGSRTNSVARVGRGVKWHGDEPHSHNVNQVGARRGVAHIVRF
jgi:hypothetical protein